MMESLFGLPAELWVVVNEIAIMPVVPRGCWAVIEGPLWPGRGKPLLELLTAQYCGMLR